MLLRDDQKCEKVPSLSEYLHFAIVKLKLEKEIFA
jgi:hypothetical protein